MVFVDNISSFNQFLTPDVTLALRSDAFCVESFSISLSNITCIVNINMYTCILVEHTCVEFNDTSDCYKFFRLKIIDFKIYLKSFQVKLISNVFLSHG